MLTFVPGWSSLRSSALSVRAQRRRKTRYNCPCTPACVSLISIASCASCVKRTVVWMFMGTLISMHEVVLAGFGLSGALNADSLFARLLPQYGYFAVLLAAFWEGEAVL